MGRRKRIEKGEEKGKKEREEKKGEKKVIRNVRECR